MWEAEKLLRGLKSDGNVIISSENMQVITTNV
jgi:hypothetical protein